MTVPTPNPAALNPAEPPALAAQDLDRADARGPHQPSTTSAGPAITTAGRAATASLTAAAPARASAAAAAVPPAPPGFGAGPSHDDRFPASPEDGESSRHGRPPRLRLGWHTMRLSVRASAGLRNAPPPSASEAATALCPPPLHSGLILGRDDAGHAVAVPMFTAEPARVTVVGGHRLAQIILIRALALGAAAVITAADPRAWQGFGRVATGEADRVVVLPAGRPVTAFGTADQPALIVDDLGASGPDAVGPQGAWQTRLTVLRTLTKSARALAGECRFLLLESPDLDDTLLLVSAGDSRRVHLTPTSVERRAFGPPLTGPPLTGPAGTTPAGPAVLRPGG
ncbi:hypothetical protein ABH935_009245 [Catenulispora sp. GAS73]|uniref:hypothetical protein n=1 Tax=Catenulispora sp. GAS73 TaxID=3156269 RepID=UPI003518C8BC